MRKAMQTITTANGEATVLVELLGGSHLYGTNMPGSDEDYRGVALEPLETLIGLAPQWEQLEVKEPDTTIYGLRKFLNLAFACNPNILDVLFAPPSSWLWRHSEYLWEAFYALRFDVLHTGVRKTYNGYANQQLHRIRTHRKWALQPPHEGHQDFPKYREYVRSRNPARYALEQAHGYDTKNAGHIVRLMFQGRELLTLGSFNPRLRGAERDMVLAVRNGAFTYDELIAWADEQMAQLADMPTALPAEPRRDRIRRLVREMTMAYCRDMHFRENNP